ncbi:ParB N-terminal domain-containing protein [Spirosoma agri]|uniref:ParB N-terminal domain-containing protein n=1 Tax=Spirosoma agri TaxID=1987381 RepID=A0A6M0IS31_9BACT|nr:hypothetical protein [Spirosoma agri]NEU70335.1 hypothetical protein [Spirosoma agri]
MAKKYQLALAANTLIKDQSLLRHEDIKQHIRILPDLAAYIPPLLEEEFRQLEENIKQNGCREALLIWETTGEQLSDQQPASTPQYVLIDGHNRYTICKKHQLDFKIHLMSFPSMEEVKFFMIDNQLGRRNLAPEQVSYLRGLRYLKDKLAKGKYIRENHKGQNDLYATALIEQPPVASSNEQASPDDTSTSTAYRLGKQFNVSEKTIKRDSIFALGLDRLSPPFKQAILSGKVKVDKGLVQQLGKSEKPVSLISTEAELQEIVQKSSTDRNRSSVSSPPDTKEKAAQLKQQLSQLVSKLSAKKVDLKQLCQEIIECAQLLQQQN